MVKKTIVGILAVILLAVVFVGAYDRWGYTRYGAVYYIGTPQYRYYPLYYYPYGSYHYWQYAPYAAPPTYNYPYSPTAGQSPYGAPAQYPSIELPRGKEYQLCGTIEGKQYGCTYGLVCDYTKTGTVGVGMCSRQTQVTTYPWQVDSTSIYPYYYG